MITISPLNACQSHRLLSERDANLDRESGSDSALVDHVAPCSIQVDGPWSGPDETLLLFLCYWFLFIFREISFLPKRPRDLISEPLRSLAGWCALNIEASAMPHGSF